METVQASLRFMGYKVQLLKFSNKTVPNNEETKIEIHPCFSRNIIKINDNKYNLELAIKIDQANLPFDAEVILVGKFELTGIQEAEKAMKQNATAILYPYVRSTLSMLTTLATVPPVNIPTINLARMFEQEKSE